VLDKTGLLAVSDILRHSAAAQRGGGKLQLVLTKLLQQLQTAPVGQAYISDEEIELLALAQFDRALRIFRGVNAMAARFQEVCKHLLQFGNGVFVGRDIFELAELPEPESMTSRKL
jgi:hypothetical protein